MNAKDIPTYIESLVCQRNELYAQIKLLEDEMARIQQALSPLGKGPRPKGAIQKLVLDHLTANPQSVSRLAKALELDSRQVMNTLLILKKKGSVRRVGFGLYALPEKG